MLGLMRALDRYLAALLLFTFGYAIVLFTAPWLWRGSFTLTVQGEPRVISSSNTPSAFYGYAGVSLLIAAVLLAWSVYAAVHAARTSESAPLRSVGSPVAMRAVGLFFIVIIVVLTVQIFR